MNHHSDWSPGMNIALKDDPGVWYLLHTRRLGGFHVWNTLTKTKTFLSSYELIEYIGGFNYIMWNPSNEQLREFAKDGRKLGTELRQFRRDIFK